MAEPKASAREQILKTAASLFAREGFRAVGIDTIVEKSGVAKMTLYRHFPSKDELIVAYLREANAGFWGWFEKNTAPYATPRERLAGLFEALQKLVTAPACYGCPFINAATEFIEPDHPGHRVAREHKIAVRARLREMAAEAGAPDPDRLAGQLVVLMDGAFSQARMFGPDPASPASGVGEAAAHLIRGEIL